MRESNRHTIELRREEANKLLALVPLDFEEFSRGRIRVLYRVLDPVWRENGDSGIMVPLREHIVRLQSVASDLPREWQVVSEHLRLAASIKDISVDTDLEDNGVWCGTAAEFDAANDEVAAKFVAGSIVFNLVWTAYEAAVEGVSGAFVKGLPNGKGARGREIFRRLGDNNHFPSLRQAVFDAFMRDRKSKEDISDEMRCALKEKNIAVIGAERLRSFRNALVHGDIRKPEPGDWGVESTYKADNDPDIGQFHNNIRITLILIQILMRSTLKANEELSGWLSEPQAGMVLLTQLHYKPVYLDRQPELGFGDADLIVDENDW